jgi:hypothetical protein
MPYKVVRPFAYGADGIHAVELVVGDEREDFGSSTAGLLLEKYIEEIDAEVAEPEVVADEPNLPVEAPIAPESRGRRRK